MRPSRMDTPSFPRASPHTRMRSETARRGQTGGRRGAVRRTAGRTRAWVARRGAVTTCPTCRAEAPDGARFCPSCGSALAVDPGAATERKVVTTLFADLVGFTALGERADPEDIDAALRSYYEMARDTIERFGGVVEKFIGDAVVGLFGVPSAHEDDAERAVRAALEIVARTEDLAPVAGERLRVRASANTGPAFVRLGVAVLGRGPARRRRRQHRGAAAGGGAADGRRGRRDHLSSDFAAYRLRGDDTLHRAREGPAGTAMARAQCRGPQGDRRRQPGAGADGRARGGARHPRRRA